MFRFKLRKPPGVYVVTESSEILLNSPRKASEIGSCRSTVHLSISNIVGYDEVPATFVVKLRVLEEARVPDVLRGCNTSSVQQLDHQNVDINNEEEDKGTKVDEETHEEGVVRVVQDVSDEVDDDVSKDSWYLSEGEEVEEEGKVGSTVSEDHECSVLLSVDPSLGPNVQCHQHDVQGH